MNTKAAKRILKKVANKHGVTEQEVRMEIEEAIIMAKANSESNVHSQFNKIKCKGDVPTPEEVLIYLSKRCEKN